MCKKKSVKSHRNRLLIYLDRIFQRKVFFILIRIEGLLRIILRFWLLDVGGESSTNRRFNFCFVVYNFGFEDGKSYANRRLWLYFKHNFPVLKTEKVHKTLPFWRRQSFHYCTNLDKLQVLKTTKVPNFLPLQDAKSWRIGCILKFLEWGCTRDLLHTWHFFNISGGYRPLQLMVSYFQPKYCLKFDLGMPSKVFILEIDLILNDKC